MATFRIEAYEVHVQTYEVEAKNRAEAIKKFVDGQASVLDGSLDYLEFAEDYKSVNDLEHSLKKDVLKAIDHLDDDGRTCIMDCYEF